MIGRAGLMNPFLFAKIKKNHAAPVEIQRDWFEVEKLLPPFWRACEVAVNEYFATARTKQWLKHLALNYPEAKEVFNEIKVHQKPIDFRLALQKRLNYSEPQTGALSIGAGALSGQ